MNADIHFTDNQGNEFYIGIRKGEVSQVWKNKMDITDVRVYFEELYFTEPNHGKNNMYSLDCMYYGAEFPTLGDLIAHISISGMDPNYEITCNGKGIGKNAIDYLIF